MSDGSREVSVAGLHHLALRCSDVDATARFYRDMLDLPLVRDHRPRSLWLGLGGGALLMIEAREAGEPSIAPVSLELFALRVCDQARVTVRERAVSNCSFDGETEHTVYLRDPDGRRVAVSSYPFEVA